MIEILTPGEVGELLRLSANKVILLARRGELPFLTVEGRMRFDAQDVEDWIKARKNSCVPILPRTVASSESGMVGGDRAVKRELR